MMNWKQFQNDEKGISSVETAIILIAFVVAAAVFAFVILNAGVFSTERGNEAVYGGLAEVSGAIELRGDMVALATTTGMTGTVDSLIFTVSRVTKGEGIALVDTAGSESEIIISYQDRFQQHPALDWQLEWLVSDGDILLEQDELAQITLSHLDAQLSPALGPNTRFTLEIKPPHGPPLSLARTAPAVMSRAMSLP